MKTSFDKLQINSEIKNAVFLDTCFFFDVFRKGRENELANFCNEKCVALTSFNAAEIVNAQDKVEEFIKNRMISFLESNNKIEVYPVNVSPGDWESEKTFVRSINNQLLKVVDDPSDAVLVATALNTDSNIISKDKHHIYTEALETFLEDKKISVFNNFF